MDPSDAIHILVLLILILLSAFFSCAETALTMANKIKMRSMAEENNKKAKRVLTLLDDQPKMLSAILICNNIVNLSASSLATSFSFRLCERMGLTDGISLATAIATGILTLLILIFGEITPKTTATLRADDLSLAFSGTILTITRILTPVIFIINKLASGVMFLMRIDPNEKSSNITEDELRTFVDVSHEEGVIESEEREMITNIVDFGDSIAKDVMVPRLDICMVPADISYDELMATFMENKYARLPVYEETKDNIIGIINLKDFVFSPGGSENFSLKSLIRDVYITYEYKNVAELFIKMRKESIPLTIVIDEYGALAGLITMEDLVEEIVGEIRDEYDEDEEDDIQKISDKEYILLGSTLLDDVNEEMNISIESEEYDTIAGHVIMLLEHLPKPGERTEDPYAHYMVLEAANNRIDKVRMILKDPTPEDETKED